MKKLRQGIHDYLSIRRSLGFKLYNQELLLNEFADFLEQQKASYITVELTEKWATLPKNATPVYWGTRMSVVRIFCQYFNSIDPQTEIPPKKLLPFSPPRAKPYYYSKTEIDDLLRACNCLASDNGLRKLTYYTLFGLLAITGMRISEVVALNNENVNLSQGYLTIQETKFKKSRLLTLHETTIQILKKYKQFCSKIYPNPSTNSFFLSDRGKRLTIWSIRYNFILISKKCGLRKPEDKYGPRIHDLRHNFTVNTLINLYESGENVEQYIPYLSTYLGHIHPSDTYWYISDVPELMGLAANRLEHELKGIS